MAYNEISELAIRAHQKVLESDLMGGGAGGQKYGPVSDVNAERMADLVGRAQDRLGLKNFDVSGMGNGLRGQEQVTRGARDAESAIKSLTAALSGLARAAQSASGGMGSRRGGGGGGPNTPNGIVASGQPTGGGDDPFDPRMAATAGRNYREQQRFEMTRGSQSKQRATSDANALARITKSSEREAEKAANKEQAQNLKDYRFDTNTEELAYQKRMRLASYEGKGVLRSNQLALTRAAQIKRDTLSDATVLAREQAVRTKATDAAAEADKKLVARGNKSLDRVAANAEREKVKQAKLDQEVNDRNVNSFLSGRAHRDANREAALAEVNVAQSSGGGGQGGSWIERMSRSMGAAGVLSMAKSPYAALRLMGSFGAAGAPLLGAMLLSEGGARAETGMMNAAQNQSVSQGERMQGMVEAIPLIGGLIKSFRELGMAMDGTTEGIRRAKELNAAQLDINAAIQHADSQSFQVGFQASSAANLSTAMEGMPTPGMPNVNRDTLEGRQQYEDAQRTLPIRQSMVTLDARLAAGQANVGTLQARQADLTERRAYEQARLRSAQREIVTMSDVPANNINWFGQQSILSLLAGESSQNGMTIAQQARRRETLSGAIAQGNANVAGYDAQLQQVSGELAVQQSSNADTASQRRRAERQEQEVALARFREREQVGLSEQTSGGMAPYIQRVGGLAAARMIRDQGAFGVANDTLQASARIFPEWTAAQVRMAQNNDPNYQAGVAEGFTPDIQGNRQQGDQLQTLLNNSFVANEQTFAGDMEKIFGDQFSRMADLIAKSLTAAIQRANFAFVLQQAQANGNSG